MKKILALTVSLFSFLVMGAMPALAVAPHDIIGGVGYNAYGLQRHAGFIANNTAAAVVALPTDTASTAATGWFSYSDANHGSYVVKIKNLQVSGNTAYFAGPVIAASDPSWKSFWLFAEVKDGGFPSGGDKVWGSFTTETAAVAGVSAMSNPGDGPFDVATGDVIIH